MKGPHPIDYLRVSGTREAAPDTGARTNGVGHAGGFGGSNPPAQTIARFEVVVTHPATCRVNLLAWDLYGPEASRILDELEADQRARQGSIVVSGRLETGWIFSAREQGHPELPPVPHTNGVAKRVRRKGRG